VQFGQSPRKSEGQNWRTARSAIFIWRFEHSQDAISMLKRRAQQLELPPRPGMFRRIKPEDRLTDPGLEQCRDHHEDRPDHERLRLSEPGKKVIPKLPWMAVVLGCGYESGNKREVRVSAASATRGQLCQAGGVVEKASKNHS
jgi:hypothetical protein